MFDDVFFLFFFREGLIFHEFPGLFVIISWAAVVHWCRICHNLSSILFVEMSMSQIFHPNPMGLHQGENRWELFHFGHGRGRGTLEQQALEFLREKRLKSALAPGLASKMRSMINAGLKQSSVDIVDLI